MSNPQTLVEKLEHAQVMLDQAYGHLIELKNQEPKTEALRTLHAAAEEALTEARAVVQLLEQLTSGSEL